MWFCMESREGKMSLDGEATDTPITVKAAARFLGVSPSLCMLTSSEGRFPITA